MTDNTTNIREVVLDVLLEVLENHNLSHIVLKQALEKYLFLERQDRAFITRCVEGTLEYRIQIDAVLDRFSKVKTAKMKPVIREILRMSVYQILYMERVPSRSAVAAATSSTLWPISFTASILMPVRVRPTLMEEQT